MNVYDILLAKKLGGGGGVTPTGTKSITSNGTYDVKSYASAHVSVPGIVPSGTYNITSNGTYNVTNYASASVSVTAPAVNIQSLNVTENGTYTASGDVDGYSPITVNVSGGGGDSRFAQLVDGTISGIVTDNTVTTIRGYAFANCSKFSTASFPNVTDINGNAFASCSSLTTVSFPNATSIGSSAFAYCIRLVSANFPNATSISPNAFFSCTSLATASLPNIKNIGNTVFRTCTRLVSLYLMGSSVPTLGGSSVFYSTPIGGYSTTAGQFGSVYVPSSLYNTYISASYWSSISARIVSM